MPHAMNVMLDGVLQFTLLLAIIAGMFVIPTASMVTVLACYAQRFGTAAIAFASGWGSATLILFLSMCLKATRGT